MTTVWTGRHAYLQLCCIRCLADKIKLFCRHHRRRHRYASKLLRSFASTLSCGQAHLLPRLQGFLEKFFPEVLAQTRAQAADKAAGVKHNPYCQYDNQGLQWFTSSLFVAGVFACLPAGWLVRCWSCPTADALPLLRERGACLGASDV